MLLVARSQRGQPHKTQLKGMKNNDFLLTPSLLPFSLSPFSQLCFCFMFSVAACILVSSLLRLDYYAFQCQKMPVLK